MPAPLRRVSPVLYFLVTGAGEVPHVRQTLVLAWIIKVFPSVRLAFLLLKNVAICLPEFHDFSEIQCISLCFCVLRTPGLKS